MGLQCSNGSCQSRESTGPCTTDDACTSGVCGIAGTGNCCTVSCTPAGGVCGASGCDAQGACQFPDSSVVCSTSCAGNVYSLGHCDGLGGCSITTTRCPGDLVCADGAVCKSSCMNTQDCISGTFCDVAGQACCPQLGGTMYVDGVQGSDMPPCCGTLASPCSSLTHSMELIASAGAIGVTLEASNGSGQADWPPANERWPVHLGLGVTLHAKAIFFTPPAGPPVDAFDIFPYGPGDTGTVTLIGYQNNMWIGLNSTRSITGATAVAVNDGVVGQVGLGIVLQNVTLSGSSEGLSLGPGAHAALGPGFVSIGTVGVPGGTGIRCQGTLGNPSSLRDDPGGTFILQMVSQDTDVEADDGCTIALTQGPSLGLAPDGDGGCTSKPDRVGLLATGNGSIEFGSPDLPSFIQCMSQDGIEMRPDPAGSGAPVVRLTATTVQHSGCSGADVRSGSLAARACTFRSNHYGLRLAEGQIDASGGVSGRNTVECSAARESGSCQQMGPGIDVLNLTAGATINLTHARLDLPGGGPPMLWACQDSTLSSCNCSGSSGCPSGAVTLPDDADLVSLSANKTPFDLANIVVSSSGCP
jgi:hypothetical protein